MNNKILGLLVGGLTLAATASPASAARVSVEVEGLSVVVPPTAVTTPATVAKGGQSCPDGANILGALDVLTNGDWDGSIYGATRILSEDHPFTPGTPGWVFMINGNTTTDYGCGAAVHDGDKVLWYASNGSPHYPASSGWSDPVLLDGPTAPVPGEAFTVAVTNATITYDPNDPYDTPTGTSHTPAAGATVSGGTAPVTTGADGKASVTVPGGPFTLVATSGNHAPTRITGCATTGSDGLCGTTAAAPSAPAPCATTGDDGRCGTPDKRAAYGFITAVKEGQKFGRGKGPRELAGRVDDEPSGIKDVQLRLTRNDRGACATYDGRREAFRALKRCGATHGVWFSVGDRATWTYLLPAKLGRGRYVLDVRVTDKAGNVDDRLARGRNRVVFTVA